MTTASLPDVIDTRKPFTLRNGMTAVLEKIRKNQGTPQEVDVATITVFNDNSRDLEFPSAFDLSRQMGGKHVRGPVSVSSPHFRLARAAVYEA
jgi:hypothetical protein